MESRSLREDVAVLLSQPALLDQISLNDLYIAITITSKLKDDIIAAQPSHHDPSVPPPALPPHISFFLAKTLGINVDLIETLWHAIAATAWKLECRGGNPVWRVAHVAQISVDNIWPPTHLCTNIHCTNYRKQLIRERDGLRQVVLFTLAGPRPTFAAHMSCTACRTTYYPNYAVQGGVRVYYNEHLDVIQAAEHHYLERRLVDLFIGMMLSSWTSATNAAKIYNTALSPSNSEPLPYSRMNKHHVFDAFIIVSLLEDCQRQQSVLHVPHTGDQSDRFTAAMTIRNQRILVHGQPDAAHFCDKCMRVFQVDGKYSKVHALVGDAVCIGHTRCSADGCPVPLSSHADRFCHLHHSLHFQCAVATCHDPIVDGTKSCHRKEHIALEVQHLQRGSAMFQLKSILQRQAVTHLDDTSASAVVLDSVETSDGMELPQQSTTFVDDTDCPTKSEHGAKLKAIHGRMRTHAEFTFNRPCGVIVARRTCVKAESLSSVHTFMKELDLIGLLPDVLFYDNGCRLYQYLAKHDPALLERVALPVDVFHWMVKHKKNDAECSIYCNPYAFPELRTDSDRGSSWYFNSSIAEQNNVWLGAYHSIVREMTFTKYNFFLDEMILRKNRMIITANSRYNSSYLP